MKINSHLFFGALPFHTFGPGSIRLPNPGVVAGVAASDTTGLDDLEELSDLESVSHCWERALSEDRRSNKEMKGFVEGGMFFLRVLNVEESGNSLRENEGMSL